MCVYIYIYYIKKKVYKMPHKHAQWTIKGSKKKKKNDSGEHQ